MGLNPSIKHLIGTRIVFYSGSNHLILSNRNQQIVCIGVSMWSMQIIVQMLDSSTNAIALQNDTLMLEEYRKCSKY